MARAILSATFVLALPAILFLVGAWAMAQVPGRKDVARQLHEKAAAKDQKPLNRRICGYDLEDVEHHWQALDGGALKSERRFLEWDLVFPFVYGGGLAAALLLAWIALGRPFHAGWLILPVAITILADWSENLVQLSQLQSYMHEGTSGLQAAWIQVASLATTLKLVFLLASCLLLAVLAAWMVCRASRPT